MRGREREDWLIQLANREGAWPNRPYECFWSKGACPESARDDYARVISDQRWPPEEKTGNCPHQSKIKAFFLNH